MKTIIKSLVMGLFLCSVAFPIGWAAESEATGTGMSGSSQEFSDLEKSLRKDKIDVLELRIENLAQQNNFLSDRVKMLERSVNDLKDKVDRSFR